MGLAGVFDLEVYSEGAGYIWGSSTGETIPDGS